jgi:hypothetical protein
MEIHPSEKLTFLTPSAISGKNFGDEQAWANDILYNMHYTTGNDRALVRLLRSSLIPWDFLLMKKLLS